MMNALKHMFSPFRWVFIYVVIYALILSIYAILINRGIALYSWEEWRIGLVVFCFIFLVHAFMLHKIRDADAIGSLAGTAMVWGIYGILAVLNMFTKWQVIWPPADWFDIATLASIAISIGISYLSTH